MTFGRRNIVLPRNSCLGKRESLHMKDSFKCNFRQNLCSAYSAYERRYQVSTERNLSREYSLVGLRLVFAVERWISGGHFIQQDSQSPPVHRLTVALQQWIKCCFLIRKASHEVYLTDWLTDYPPNHLTVLRHNVGAVEISWVIIIIHLELWHDSKHE